MIQRLRLYREIYQTVIGSSAVLPLKNVLLALSGFLFTLSAILKILRGRREKKSEEQLNESFRN